MEVFDRVIQDLEFVEHIFSVESILEVYFDHVSVILNLVLIHIDLDLLAEPSLRVRRYCEILLLLFFQLSSLREILLIVLLSLHFCELHILV